MINSATSHHPRNSISTYIDRHSTLTAKLDIDHNHLPNTTNHSLFKLVSSVMTFLISHELTLCVFAGMLRHLYLQYKMLGDLKTLKYGQ